MITLPMITLTDTSATATGTADEASPATGDFLALLSQTLQGKLTASDGKPLNINDLKANLTGKNGTRLPVSTLPGDETDTAQQMAGLLANLDMHDAKHLYATLTAHLTQAQTTEDDDPARTDSEQPYFHGELAALNALFTMPTQRVNDPESLTVASETAMSGQGADALPGMARPAIREIMTGRTDSGIKGKNAEPAVTGAAPAPVSAWQSTDVPLEKMQSDNNAIAAPQQQHTLTQLAATINTSHSTTSQIATPVAPHLSAQLGTAEWQASLSQHITLFTRQGKQSAELRLNPESLGHIQINLKIDDNQAQLHMVSAHSHVRAALEAALPTLRAQLADNGIQLGQSDISSESFAGQQQADQQQQRQAGRSSFIQTGNDDETIAVPDSLQAAARGTNAVDIFA